MENFKCKNKVESKWKNAISRIKMEDFKCKNKVSKIENEIQTQYGYATIVKIAECMKIPNKKNLSI